MDRIKELIRKRGLTQEQFAQELNITRSALIQQLSGKPSLTTLERYAEILEVPVWQLFISPDEVINGVKNDIIGIIKIGKENYIVNSIEDIKKLAEVL